VNQWFAALINTATANVPGIVSSVTGITTGFLFAQWLKEEKFTQTWLG
jgi:hypothetical protein